MLMTILIIVLTLVLVGGCDRLNGKTLRRAVGACARMAAAVAVAWRHDHAVPGSQTACYGIGIMS